MTEKKKEPKKRPEKYDTKLAVKGTFDQVIAAAFVNDKKPKDSIKK
ncbi:MAG TPA: hypothetical protein VNX01_06145 [Bacteroidia bacterium]|jgi:hypothetical protein|nr:hypothetical protein [Bacteroidia bacterium]